MNDRYCEGWSSSREAAYRDTARSNLLRGLGIASSGGVSIRTPSYSTTALLAMTEIDRESNDE